ncbi:putative nucleophile aminohydrolase [Monocercomonoides exilis]|uniref:putative nucleophile aminohydrolase n=1 Tax=Monocercomonoides exilis TaxID=2049356 RepID=UPI0035599E16|nr:putative nucleophile aminohydrolase [Monocercomonoides exilis]
MVLIKFFMTTSAVGAGYDYSTSTFSNDGRVFQVEYAMKATEKSGTAIGIKCVDGVVVACVNFQISPLVVPYSQSRILTAAKSIGLVSAGLLADGRHLASHCKETAADYKKNYHEDIPVRVLAERLSIYLQQFTQFGAYRPFGVSTIIAGYDDKPQLYSTDPAATLYGYNGVAIGKEKAQARTDIEMLPLDKLTCEQAVKEAAKILYGLRHEDEKAFELEFGWVRSTDKIFGRVPDELRDQAIEEAKKWLEEKDE